MRSFARSVLPTFLTCVCLATSLFAQSPGKQPPVKTARGSVSGRITIKDKPAPGVMVGLRGNDILSAYESFTRAVTDADGKNIRYITDNGTDYFNGPHDRNPAFSPDGQFIVFERNAPDFSSSSIYVIRPDGTEMKALVTMPHTKTRTRKTDSSGRPEKIEEGGNTPRWGVAPRS